MSWGALVAGSLVVGAAIVTLTWLAVTRTFSKLPWGLAERDRPSPAAAAP